jgi:hypothetical protein
VEEARQHPAVTGKPTGETKLGFGKPSGYLSIDSPAHCECLTFSAGLDFAGPDKLPLELFSYARRMQFSVLFRRNANNVLRRPQLSAWWSSPRQPELEKSSR